uniref:Uncharacterized protein n=1 Tax=Alexandrium monilatum TaxID=311494 RepID=A0A7S4QFD0_9DINO
MAPPCQQNPPDWFRLGPKPSRRYFQAHAEGTDRRLGLPRGSIGALVGRRPVLSSGASCCSCCVCRSHSAEHDESVRELGWNGQVALLPDGMCWPKPDEDSVVAEMDGAEHGSDGGASIASSRSSGRLSRGRGSSSCPGTARSRSWGSRMTAPC